MNLYLRTEIKAYLCQSEFSQYASLKEKYSCLFLHMTTAYRRRNAFRRPTTIHANCLKKYSSPMMNFIPRKGMITSRISITEAMRAVAADSSSKNPWQSPGIFKHICNSQQNFPMSFKSNRIKLLCAAVIRKTSFFSHLSIYFLPKFGIAATIENKNIKIRAAAVLSLLPF